MYPGDVFWERKVSIKIEVSEIWLRRRPVIDGGWRLCGELDFFLVHRLPRQTDELSYDTAVYYNQIRHKRAAKSWGANMTLLNRSASFFKNDISISQPIIRHTVIRANLGHILGTFVTSVNRMILKILGGQLSIICTCAYSIEPLSSYRSISYLITNIHHLNFYLWEFQSTHRVEHTLIDYKSSDLQKVTTNDENKD